MTCRLPTQAHFSLETVWSKSLRRLPILNPCQIPLALFPVLSWGRQAWCLLPWHPSPRFRNRLPCRGWEKNALLGSQPFPDGAVSLLPPLGWGLQPGSHGSSQVNSSYFLAFSNQGGRGMCPPLQQPSCVDNTVCSSHLPREKPPYLFCATYLGKTHFSLLKELIIVFLETKKKSLSGSKQWLKKII